MSAFGLHFVAGFSALCASSSPSAGPHGGGGGLSGSAYQRTSGDITSIQEGVRTTVANSLWGDDAFPGTPELRPNQSLTIGFWNSTGGGVVTEIHLVLSGLPRRELQRHIAFKVTYDELPYPSVFVPLGDFFLDQVDSDSNCFESAYFAKRPRRSWHAFAPMPYRTSIKLELVSKASAVVKGYNYVYHDSKPFAEGTGYFHAVYQGNIALRFPWEPAKMLPFQGIEGPGHLIGTSLTFTGMDGSKFAGTFEHVCEGNYELYFDNSTALMGNDSAVDYANSGYQTSTHVIAVLGSEDWFGYSYGWAGDELELGKSGFFGTRHSGTTYWDEPTNKSRTLATYRFFPAPLRFSSRAWGQVNWHYDTGHNVPENLCPPGNGCAVAYSIMSYWYLAKPRNASPELALLPWLYPSI
jgi:hypothetical protein